MYWAAGRLNALGENPYDPEKLLPLEREAGREVSDAFIMFSPPPALTFVMPFGLLNHAASRVLWLLCHFILVLLAADTLWGLYGGPARYRWLSWVLGIGFGPTLIMLRMGQIGDLVLLGIVGFLYFAGRSQWALAGAMAALTALKPQIVYLFAVALLFWSLDRRRWRILLGGLLAGVAATVIALACNPLVIQQYREALARHPPAEWITPTLGTVLRLALGAQRSRLQYVPPLFGLLWLLFYALQRRRTWSWLEQTPVLLLVSFLTTFYGAWSHDYVVMLVPVIQIAAAETRLLQETGFACSRRLVLSSLALYLALGAFTLSVANEVWYVVLPPALLVSFLALRKQVEKQTSLVIRQRRMTKDE